MISPPELITHDQVTLRRWREDDAPALLAAVLESEEHLRPWMPWADGYDAGRAGEYLASCQTQWASGDDYSYAIIIDDQIVGSCGLHNRIGPDGLEIGYWVHQDWINRGIATGAAAALTGTALSLPGIDHVEIHHDVANTASGRIPAKLGYERVGEQPTRQFGGHDRAAGETGTSAIWRIGH